MYPIMYPKCTPFHDNHSFLARNAQKYDKNSLNLPQIAVKSPILTKNSCKYAYFIQNPIIFACTPHFNHFFNHISIILGYKRWGTDFYSVFYCIFYTPQSFFHHLCLNQWGTFDDYPRKQSLVVKGHATDVNHQ